MNSITLYDYWRSSASYRVRIALNLAGLDYTLVSINLLDGEHKSAAHLEKHPQGLVPVLDIDGTRLTQSLAILEYLDVTRSMALQPNSPAARAQVQAMAHTLAVDVHPVCNLSVVAHVASLQDGAAEARESWMKKDSAEPTQFCVSDTPGLADICLMPQLYNADRWGVDYQDCEHILAVQSSCTSHDAFQRAHPDAVNPT